MEGASVVTIERYTYKTVEAYIEYDKWGVASLNPMMMSTGFRLSTEHSVPLENNLTYVSLSHYKDLESYFSFIRSAERSAYENDTHTTWRGKFEESWRALYLVVKRFTLFQVYPINKGTIVDKTTYLKEFTENEAPVLLIKGLGLSPEEWGKYDVWMNEWGYDIYLPMLLKVPGIIEYCRCCLSNINRKDLVPKLSYTLNEEFPQDLSIIYFENMKAYKTFLNSKELAAFEKTLTAAFPGGLNYEWDIAFPLVRRWSK